MARVDDFPSCCGLTILHGLYDLSADDARGFKRSRNDRGSVIAVTTTDQRGAISSLKAAGFEAVAQLSNSYPRGKRILTIWLSHPHKVKKAAPKKKVPAKKKAAKKKK